MNTKLPSQTIPLLLHPSGLIEAGKHLLLLSEIRRLCDDPEAFAMLHEELTRDTVAKTKFKTIY